MRRLLVVLALAVTACSTRFTTSAPGTPLVPLANVSSEPESIERALDQILDADLIGGNQAELVNNGEIFTALEREARAAQKSIHLDLFIWSPSEPSLRTARVIAERARAGVACRVVVDPFGSVGFSDQIGPLLIAAGCEVRQFRAFGQTEPGTLTNRNHRKIAVFDGRIGFTGGFGLDAEWQGDARNPDEWRDTNIRVEGPVTRQVQHAFFEDWKVAGGKVPKGAIEEVAPVGDARAAFVVAKGNLEQRHLTRAEAVVRVLIAAAHQRLWIANAYFVPSDEILTLLASKARAGVDVRILIPGPHVDSKFVPLAQRACLQMLLDAGVKLYAYQPTMMHAKTALVEQSLVAVGSINLDPFSLKVAREDALIVESRSLAQAFEHDFEEDLSHSRQWLAAPPGVLDGLARHIFWMLGKYL